MTKLHDTRIPAAGLAAACALGASLFLLTTPSRAQGQAAQTAQGLKFLSGGATLDERRELNRVRGDYALKLCVAAKGSGAYLSDAQVEISDARGSRVVATQLDGPCLLVDLSQGEYRIEVQCEGQRRTLRASIGANRHPDLTVFFTEHAEEHSPHARP
jgi:hypothetical protein